MRAPRTGWSGGLRDARILGGVAADGPPSGLSLVHRRRRQACRNLTHHEPIQARWLERSAQALTHQKAHYRMLKLCSMDHAIDVCNAPFAWRRSYRAAPLVDPGSPFAWQERSAVRLAQTLKETVSSGTSFVPDGHANENRRQAWGTTSTAHCAERLQAEGQDIIGKTINVTLVLDGGKRPNWNALVANLVKRPRLTRGPVTGMNDSRIPAGF